MTLYSADPEGKIPYAPRDGSAVFLTPEAALQAALYYSSFKWIAAAFGVNPGTLRSRFAAFLATQPDRLTAMHDALRSWSETFTEEEAGAILAALEKESKL